MAVAEEGFKSLKGLSCCRVVACGDHLCKKIMVIVIVIV